MTGDRPVGLAQRTIGKWVVGPRCDLVRDGKTGNMVHPPGPCQVIHEAHGEFQTSSGLRTTRRLNRAQRRAAKLL